MKTKQHLSDYLQFSRKDRIAIFIIATILLTAFLLPSVLEYTSSTLPASADTAWISALKQLEKPAPETITYEQGERKPAEEYGRDRAADRYNNGQQAQLFSFDPNTLDNDGWKRLGVKEKTAGTIRKYLDKGGRFKQANDLRKIYGLQPDLAERLMPYVRINPLPLTSSATSFSAPSTPASKDGAWKRESPRQAREIMPVDINTGDSLAFENLPGIGPVLASRIIRFREKLGGFYDIKQISETFGLSDSAFSVIKAYLRIKENTVLQKININSVDISELRKHPYIKQQVAIAIINYRTQHGLFNSAEQLKQVWSIDAALYQKLIPYIRL